MSRLIEKIENPVDNLHETNEFFKFFTVTMEYILGFAPDRKGCFRRNEQQINSSIPSLMHFKKLQDSLEKEFFKELYIERDEKKEILNLLFTKRVILVHGLMGTGKSVVLMKIRNELDLIDNANIFYFDLKAKQETLKNPNSKDFFSSYRNMLFSELMDSMVYSSASMIQAWLVYRVKYLEPYSKLKQYIYDNVQKEIIDEESWLEILKSKDIKNRFDDIQAEPDLIELFKFLSAYKETIVCLDNVDLFEIHKQRQLLEDAINISNECGITVILALRTPNLRRLGITGAQSDIIHVVELKRITPRYDKQNDLLTSELSDSPLIFDSTKNNASLEKLLQKRFDFIKTNNAFNKLGEVFYNLKDELNKEWTPDEYFEHFWEIFDDLVSTFIDVHIYEYCNRNLRAILVKYFEIINKFILYPDPQCSLKDLLSTIGRTTKLRTYLYKSLICGEIPLPLDKTKVPNPFICSDTGISNLIINIITYLCNNDKENEGIKIGKIVSTFRDFGIGKAPVLKVIEDLTEFQAFNEHTLLWKDSEKIILSEEVKVFLMPAGKYYLERLSISREFIFWMGMTLNLSDDEIEKFDFAADMNFETTLDDQKKLEFVYNFFEYVIVPRYEMNMLSVLDDLVLPQGWKGNKLDYLKKVFQYNDMFYEERILLSISKTIHYSDIEQSQKEYFRELNEKMIELLNNSLTRVCEKLSEVELKVCS